MSEAATQKLAEALLRAVPISRMLDYGMARADADSLTRRVIAGEAWDRVSEELARKQLAGAGPDGDPAARWRASACYMIGQLAFNFDTPRKVELYEAAAETLRGDSSGDLRPLRLDHQGKDLFGWALTPTGDIRGAIVIIGGLSGWGSAFLGMARALAKAGLAVVLAEGPGQGLTRMRSKLFLRRETLAALSVFIDHAAELGRPVGVWGNSYGALMAAWTAALDERVRAVCLNGALPQIDPPAFRTALEQMQAAFGLDDVEQVPPILAGLNFPVDRQRIRCPILVLEGGADPLVPLGGQTDFFAAGTSGDHTLRTWADGEHTLYNHCNDRDREVADWFAARLSSAPA